MYIYIYVYIYICIYIYIYIYIYTKKVTHPADANCEMSYNGKHISAPRYP